MRFGFLPECITEPLISSQHENYFKKRNIRIPFQLLDENNKLKRRNGELIIKSDSANEMYQAMD